MARPSVAARNLSLTEELEKLEQSITLTLQEIDHNFSKAHRIVTTSIIPLVEQYGDHSRAVWEASKFWKQFFEASANVSLSGYEEGNNNNNQEPSEVTESTAMREDSEIDYSMHQDGDLTTQSAAEHAAHYHEDDSELDHAELTGSTPRPPATKTIKMTGTETPYETLKKEMKYEEGHTTVLEDDDDEDDTSVLFAQRTARLPDTTLTHGILRDPTSILQSAQKGKDPLLHSVLDKNYRIQATPHKPQLPISSLKAAGKEKERTPTAPSWRDDSPMSSPEIAMPKLRSEAFMSPYKSSTVARQRLAAATKGGPRTPGLSVQTPIATKKTRDVFAASDESAMASEKAAGNYDIDWDLGGEDDDDEDFDLYAGKSPPKTIQFALPPSKLLQTPARVASKRIVEDILYEAGEDPNGSEYSPTMVKMSTNIHDDTF